MQRVAVRILHPQPGGGAGELTRLLASARAIAGNELRRGLSAAGAEDVQVVTAGPDGQSFGARLRSLGGALEPDKGLIVLGSGSIPLANETDLALLVDVARSGEPRAITNNRYSSDVVAIGAPSILARVPDLRADNALPRWLETVAGVRVDELPDRVRLSMDIDSPLDLELLRRDARCPLPLAELARSMAHRLDRARHAFDELTEIGGDPHKELMVAGRLSADALRRLEVGTACRIRALIEERGLRASARLIGDGARRQRPPASVLGLLLDRDGPDELGSIVARVSDGAIIDTRVLLAHRLGADEAAWPSPEDRFASDLLLADRVRDKWLQQLTLHAWSHAVPIALGGHSLVGPGLGAALGIPA